MQSSHLHNPVPPTCWSAAAAAVAMTRVRFAVFRMTKHVIAGPGQYRYRPDILSCSYPGKFSRPVAEFLHARTQQWTNIPKHSAYVHNYRTGRLGTGAISRPLLLLSAGVGDGNDVTATVTSALP